MAGALMFSRHILFYKQLSISFGFRKLFLRILLTFPLAKPLTEKASTSAGIRFKCWANIGLNYGFNEFIH